MFEATRWCRNGKATAMCVTVAALALSACSGDEVVAPHTHETTAPQTPSLVRTAMTTASSALATAVRFIDTALGEQPAVTPMLRIDSPTFDGRVRRDTPVTIRVRYADFDFRPELRTPNAGATLGSLPQTVVDGVVQGHIHGYLQRLPDDGSLPDANATSFCVLERSVTRTGYDGVAEGECPGVPAGTYRLSAEFQSHSHTAILKTGPRATVTGDVIIVKVR
jgi:hypothetical protein